MKIYILGIIACFFCSACNPENCPNELLYELPFVLLNPSDTISVGDTLWYESKFNKVLFDKNGNIENVFEDYDFSFIFCAVLKIDSTIEQGGGFGLGTIQKDGTLQKYTFSDGYEVYDLYYHRDEDGYRLKYGFVFNASGLFTIQTGYLDTDKKTTTNCTKHYVAWQFPLNIDDTNFEMLQTSPIQFWQNYKRSDWDRLASYCVYVRP
jgi:hypothetical protein